MIGYYVHHQGAGHRQRCAAVAAHLRVPVTGLSSLPAPAGWAGGWVELARDDDPAPAGTGLPPGAVGGADETARGRLHWVPRHHPGLRARTAQVAAWIERERPSLLVVDVSVEIALLGRLMGVPVVWMAMLGERTDPAHRLALDVADALVAPWPQGRPEPGWPLAWRRKTEHVGAFGRFDGRDPGALPSGGPPTGAGRDGAGRDGDGRTGAGPDGAAPGRRVLVLWGSGGDDVTDAERAAARAATPGWTWHERLGGPPPRSSGSVDGPPVLSSDPPDGTGGAAGSADDGVWEDLLAADVVVVHGGHNAVAEVAAARRPAVVVAQQRPHDEQVHRVRRLSEEGIATGVERWPSPEAWPALLEAAAAHGGRAWERWSPGDGAARAARALEDLARAHGEP